MDSCFQAVAVIAADRDRYLGANYLSIYQIASAVRKSAKHNGWEVEPFDRKGEYISVVWDRDRPLVQSIKLQQLPHLPPKPSIVGQTSLGMDQDAIRAEASRLLDLLHTAPFDDCYPLSRTFQEVPNRAGIYAIKHRTEAFCIWANRAMFELDCVAGIKR